jgi:hypothetical protein
MNAPLRQGETTTAVGALSLFAVFHLNLAFSSIEIGQRFEVIRRCYWPLLHLAQAQGPIGIELSGYTLEEIARLDPEWCGRMRGLIARERVELIGSGYSQLIGPLVPARVTENNLRLGHCSYQTHLGVRPHIALVNEQAYSAGLVSLYLAAGYRAILMDWDNPAAQHPDWHAETRYRPQLALGSDGQTIALLWTSTVAFQKLQRLAHGDVSLNDYLAYIRTRRGEGARAFCIYGNDAEIFDHRPGRYRTEERLAGGEWRKLGQAFARLNMEPACRLAAPGAVLAQMPPRDAPLRLESAACPVPVKKQRKYNLARWAVTGRDDVAINAACERIYRALTDTTAGDDDWKELCYLWSSDFRTHITDMRWTEYCERLRQMEETWGTSADLVADRFMRSPGACSGAGRDGEASSAASRPLRGRPVSSDDAATTPHARKAHVNKCATHQILSRYCGVETPAVSATLDRRRGLAITRLRFAGDAHAAVGGIPHGHFDDIALQADWYTGDCVFEAPGEHKVTDLEWCDAELHELADGDVIATARIETPRGPIAKTMRFRASTPRVDFEVVFDWSNWGRGSLRLGHVTLLPDAFDWDRITLTTHNGGKDRETFSLGTTIIDHGAPVSFLVSSSSGFGMTEGWAELGDDRTRVRIDVDRTTAPLLGMLIHRRIGGSLFCQIVLSALELDETSKPFPYRPGPRKFCFSLSRAAV